MTALVSFGIFIFVIIILLGLPLLFIRVIYPGLLRKKPSFAIITAMFFVLLGFLTALFIFQSAISIAMVSFSALMLLPFVVKFLDTENDQKVNPEIKTQTDVILPTQKRQWLYARSLAEIFTRHERLIQFYIFLFAGMAIMYTLIFAVFPPSITNNAFSDQLALLQPRGSFVVPDLFWQILTNNIQLFFFSSRRRHTRLVSDWSSDVCSSDLMIRHTRLVSDWSSDVCSSDLMIRHTRLVSDWSSDVCSSDLAEV